MYHDDEQSQFGGDAVVGEEVAGKGFPVLGGARLQAGVRRHCGGVGEALVGGVGAEFKSD